MYWVSLGSSSYSVGLANLIHSFEAGQNESLRCGNTTMDTENQAGRQQ